ncbi:hypothetical protein [Microbacterium sp. SMR1]|uniref:hypothetical protein n=1 Tax=Microbacterium sp. SMR1 TaxID=1497340 RepID=UPI0011BDC8DC|nr:hypothetical protein [Microbacterium sp. SMR1]
MPARGARLLRGALDRARSPVDSPRESLLRVALEYQGDEHRTSRRRWLDDLTRVQLLEDAGYRVILVRAADLEDDARSLAARIRRALA